MDLAVQCCETKIQSKLIQRGLQVLDVHLRSVLFAAAAAEGASSSLAGLLVEGHAKRQRPLDDVKEFSEWQVEQQTNHARGVCHSDEWETVTTQEVGADG